jgi:DNA repair protein RadA/Sms
MDKSQRSVFYCTECGHESLKWIGQCPGCRAWNTFTEHTPSRKVSSRRPRNTAPPRELSAIEASAAPRAVIGLGEFDRVMGGGLVSGSLVLLSGEPGIGKSTLLLQVAALAAKHGKVVYVSGEESEQQVKLRAARLGIDGSNLYLLCETDLATIIDYVNQFNPSLVIVDSIQTVYLPECEGSPGSVSQVREATLRLMQTAKTDGITALVSGHVTKEGNIAGPKVLEHIVDVVLYLEGEAFGAYRLLRSAKNRFGSTNEIGVFEMKAQGMIEVMEPSQAFISQRLPDAVGASIVPTLEGSRPLLVEVQALTNLTSFGQPRRTVSGVDFNRMVLITAVLGKRAHLKLGNQDIIVNVTGGIRVSEPAADLGIALAIASSYRDRAVASDLVAIGEVGLSGELRAVSQLERRVAEAARLGFKRCLIPKTSAKINATGINLIPVATLTEAVNAGLVKTKASDTEKDLFDD